ncbi:unnamed protein product [Bemisia tabaci]|uniref:Uncharacterized protein n=1 Tax=Bemisia tabaci TaxID=7038 RepID=A0A9P0CCB1_BEMTA|nr:unnamed protein product [Bemisia tabaci]
MYNTNNEFVGILSDERSGEARYIHSPVKRSVVRNVLYYTLILLLMLPFCFANTCENMKSSTWLCGNNFLSDNQTFNALSTEDDQCSNLDNDACMQQRYLLFTKPHWVKHGQANWWTRNVINQNRHLIANGEAVWIAHDLSFMWFQRNDEIEQVYTNSSSLNHKHCYTVIATPSVQFSSRKPPSVCFLAGRRYTPDFSPLNDAIDRELLKAAATRLGGINERFKKGAESMAKALAFAPPELDIDAESVTSVNTVLSSFTQLRRHGEPIYISGPPDLTRGRLTFNGWLKTRGSSIYQYLAAGLKRPQDLDRELHSNPCILNNSMIIILLGTNDFLRNRQFNFKGYELIVNMAWNFSTRILLVTIPRLPKFNPEICKVNEWTCGSQNENLFKEFLDYKRRYQDKEVTETKQEESKGGSTSQEGGASGPKRRLPPLKKNVGCRKSIVPVKGESNEASSKEEKGNPYITKSKGTDSKETVKINTEPSSATKRETFGSPFKSDQNDDEFVLDLDNQTLQDVTILLTGLSEKSLSAEEICNSDVWPDIVNMLKNVKESVINSSQNAKLWCQFMDMMDLLRTFLRAERTEEQFSLDFLRTCTYEEIKPIADKLKLQQQTLFKRNFDVLWTTSAPATPIIIDV